MLDRTLSRLSRWPTWAWGVVLVLLLGFVYGPALDGALLWDDPAHVTRTDLRSLAGLGRIWFELGATQQYYPVLHSAFWFEHRLWGDAVMGYHLTNVALHAASSVLLALFVRRVARLSTDSGASGGVALSRGTPLPGGAEWVIALLFAVHPVAVESVAWICEQKNTLSLFLALAAGLSYLAYDGARGRQGTRRRWTYVGATALFLLALGTKTVTATLPAVLLVLLWWARGRLSWRGEIRPLVPWFGAALAAGLTTAWVEKHFIGAKGEAFDLTAFDRLLLAARVSWSYLHHAVWPAELMFFYPRWDVRATWPLGLLALVGAVAVLAVGVTRARRGQRGLLATTLLFGGVLFPALGFVDVFPFQFSWLADHFQYHALTPLIAGCVAGGCAWLAPEARRVALVAVVLVAGTFGVLARQQSALYRNNETLFRATVDRNPGSWMAHHILATALAKVPERSAEAVVHFRESIRLHDRYADAHVGLAVELAKRPEGKDEAIRHYRTALILEPRFVQAHYNLGVELLGRADGLAEAIAQFETVLSLDPRFAEAHENLANGLSRMPHRAERALHHYEAAVQLKPGAGTARAGLANQLMRLPGRSAEAVRHYELAVQSAPEVAWIRRNFGMALAQLGRSAEALQQVESALELRPDDPETHNAAAILQAQQGNVAAAREHWQAALRINPRFEAARRNLQQLETR